MSQTNGRTFECLLIWLWRRLSLLKTLPQTPHVKRGQFASEASLCISILWVMTALEEWNVLPQTLQADSWCISRRWSSRCLKSGYSVLQTWHIKGFGGLYRALEIIEYTSDTSTFSCSILFMSPCWLEPGMDSTAKKKEKEKQIYHTIHLTHEIPQ